MNYLNKRAWIAVVILMWASSPALSTTILQRSPEGKYIWYLNTYRGSGGLGVSGVLAMQPASRARWLPTVKYCSTQHGMDWQLIDIIIKAESAYNRDAVSPKGAKGFMQLMPATANDLGVNINNPRENICGGTRYFSDLLSHYGELPLALAAYNAGSGNVAKYGGIPPFQETIKYVDKIVNEYAVDNSE